MKKRIPAKNPTKEFIVDQEKAQDTSTNGTWHLIALKASELYEQRGRVDGYALEDWVKAEAILNGEAE